MVTLTHHNAGYFCNGIGIIGRLERAGEQILFLHGLGCQLGVDAAGAQKHQALDFVHIRRVDDVGLYGQVVPNELGRVNVVGQDAADFGGGQKHIGRLRFFKKLSCSVLACQVQLAMGSQQQVGVARRLQVANDGRANQATVACDVDFVCFLHAMFTTKVRRTLRNTKMAGNLPLRH